MMKRVLVVSWLAVATALLVAGCSDLAGEERRTERLGENVSIDQLPAPAKAAVEREAAGGQIREISKETERGKTSYEVKIAKGGHESTFRIAADGTPLKQGQDDDDDDD
jgi:hypothetical protein